MIKHLVLLLLFMITCWALRLSRSERRRARNLDHAMEENLQLLTEKLNHCVPKREPQFDKKDVEKLVGHNALRQFQRLRFQLLSESDENYYGRLDQCLDHVENHIIRYHRALKKLERLERESLLRSLLSREQMEELVELFRRSDDVDPVEQKIRSHFKQLPESFLSEHLIPQMLGELEVASRRGARSVSTFDHQALFKSSETSDTARIESRNTHPLPLNEEQLSWMSDKDKSAVQRLKDNGASRWDVMNKLGELYYETSKDIRARSATSLHKYCVDNLSVLMGSENFQLLREMHDDSATVEKIDTKFQEIVGMMPDEKERIAAEHYGQFCRKIFRLNHFEPTDLTSWLTAKQKFLIGEMIQDETIGDDKVYRKVFDFYNATTGEQREEAQEIIETGCKWFIAHIFGDATAEEFEEQRTSGNMTKQQLAARLAFHAQQIQSARSRKRAMDSLPICIRIYIGYNLSCDCNGKSETCDTTRHSCMECRANTYGVQCEKNALKARKLILTPVPGRTVCRRITLCLDRFTLNPVTKECEAREEESEESEGSEDTKLCQCNGHAQCDDAGKCLTCAHNTTGSQCEQCADGFYGDAFGGQEDDCSPCPCPNDGKCAVNSAGLVECLECPSGTKGITCQIKDTSSSESNEDDRFFK